MTTIMSLCADSPAILCRLCFSSASGFGIARVVGLTHLSTNGDSSKSYIPSILSPPTRTLRSSSPQPLPTDTNLLPVILDTCEYAITMICVCIPVCNPLWISWARRIFWSRSRRNRHRDTRQRNGRKMGAWWGRGRWRQRQRQSLHDEVICDEGSLGGGIRIEIGGPGGRVIRFNGGGGAVGAGGGKHTVGGQQQQGRGRATYATHTIGGSDMAAKDELDVYLHASIGGRSNKNSSKSARRGNLERSNNGSVIVDADTEIDDDDDDEENRWQQPPRPDEQQQRRRSATAWIKHKSAKMILGSRSSDEERPISEIELRADAFENDRAHLYESRERRGPRLDNRNCDIEAGLSRELPHDLEPYQEARRES